MSRKPKKTVKTLEYLRPPVVTVMGHVDHGKTTLLDYIRKTNVAAKEAGGITQHIGAYRVKIEGKKEQQEKWITFIDTPGHEAFAKMRARGAQVTDIVILVVAANDGVMPQTIESIQHVKAAKVPLIVAINKIDLAEADIEKVKRQLAKNNVSIEGYGGDVVCVPLSAKTGKGVKDLLEVITLFTEMNPDKFKADPKGVLEAYVIESKLDKHYGPQASILVKNGTLKVGEEIKIEGIKSKIRQMIDEWGKNITEAGPSAPVKIFGLEMVPAVGAKVEYLNKNLATQRRRMEKRDAENLATQRRRIGTAKTRNGERHEEEEEAGQKLKIILKADTLGSLEALTYSLPENLEIFEKGAGEITESDILLAKTVGAVVLGFNVGVSKEVTKLAETEKVLVKTYKIIYELLEEINEVIKELQKPKQTEKILGKAKIIADFLGTSGRIAGCKVAEGKITPNDQLRVERGKKIISDNLKIISMKHLKEEINKASMGMECGLVFSSEVDFRIGDMIVSYRKLV